MLDVSSLSLRARGDDIHHHNLAANVAHRHRIRDCGADHPAAHNTDFHRISPRGEGKTPISAMMMTFVMSVVNS
jgi:hypothetical protein